MKIRPALGRLVLVALAVSACATRVPPIGMDARPFTPDPDERVLWAQAEGEAETLLARVPVDDDPALAAYLARLVERLTPEAVRAAGTPVLRVTVLRDPSLNAFALPDGHVLVHTGLLAAVESEAQLALVLAREVAHVVQRDALAASRDGRVAPVRYDGAAVLSPTAAAILGERAPLARLGAITGYAARTEREADAWALAALVRGGWDATSGAAVYDVLAGDATERGSLEVFLLGSPTLLRTRRTAIGELLAARPMSPGVVRTSDEFEARRVRVTRDNAVDDARAGRFALAAAQLDRVLAATPGDARAHVDLGDLHRLRAQRAVSSAERAGELEQARRAYERALALDPEGADVHRQLGLLYYQQHDVARARRELQEYLRRAGGAADAARVAEYVRELER